MTNQEAIDLLDNLIGMIEDNHGSDYDSAIRMAIDALTEPEIIIGKEQQGEALCHEILHGILVHIGKDELSQDESFVQCLSNALYQSFEPKFMRGDSE